MPRASDDSRRNPEAMTSEERQDEISRILARGLVRAVRIERDAASRALREVKEGAATCLELSSDPSLTVATRSKSRPAGEGDA
ncbi:MAG: hypothetical protein ACNA8P_04810 [Phycisphaerales bacterium]